VTPQRGTARGVTRAALVEAFRDRTELANRVNAGTLTIYDGPGPGGSLFDDDGDLLDLLWIQDSTEVAEVGVEVFSGGDPVQYDEVVRHDVIIQTIRRGQAATIFETDRAAEEIYGEVMGTIAGQADVVDGGPDDPTTNGDEVTISAVRMSSGWLPDFTGFGTRIEVELEAEARFLLS
jgi:hypothetical protein